MFIPNPKQLIKRNYHAIQGQGPAPDPAPVWHGSVALATRHFDLAVRHDILILLQQVQLVSNDGVN
jgi:hypothetical protein